MLAGIKQKVLAGIINKIKEAKKVKLIVDPNHMLMPFPINIDISEEVTQN